MGPTDIPRKFLLNFGYLSMILTFETNGTYGTAYCFYCYPSRVYTRHHGSFVYKRGSALANALAKSSY